MTGPVGCGLCGIDSLAQAVRQVSAVAAFDLTISPGQVRAAVAGLAQHQPLHDVTRAVHAAMFWTPGQGVRLVREDVGRHNALDKLAGAMVQSNCSTDGAVVLTSRVSIDLVQKIAILGVPILIAVSAPTAAAVQLAETAGITLIALARSDRFEVFTHPHRLTQENAAHVA
jgi:FdhD protein